MNDHGGDAQQVDVLLLTPDYPPAIGGIQHMLHRLASLARVGSVAVSTCEHPGDEAFDRGEPVPVDRAPTFGRGGKLRLLALNVGCVRSALRRKPSLVVSGHTVTAPAARLVKRLRGTPYVQLFYADEVTARPWLARFAAKGADRTIVISRYTRQLAVDVGAHPDKLVLMLPGVQDPGPIAPRADPRPTIVTVSRLVDRYKGHDVVLRALPLVLARVPDARWVIVGEGPLRPDLEAATAAAGLEGSVQFEGRVSLEERTAWLDAADVFVMVSRLPPFGGGEGFGIVYLEAACRGVPSVAGNVAGAVDAVTPETGVLVDPTDHVAVADALTGLLLDDERRLALGAAARERAKTFSWKLVAERFDEILAAAMDRP